MKPSKYQEAIYDFVRHGKGNAFVEAVAGSGKTTTAIEIAKIVREELGYDATFLAFNKDIVVELQKRMDNKDIAKTLNSLGNSALWNFLGKKKLTLESYKYSNLIQKRLEDRGMEKKGRFYEIAGQIRDIVSFSQSYLVDAQNDDELRDMVYLQGLDMPNNFLSESDVFGIVQSVLIEGEAMAKNRIISFDDQIWLPIKWNLTIPQSRFVLVGLEVCGTRWPYHLRWR